MRTKTKPRRYQELQNTSPVWLHLMHLMPRLEVEFPPTKARSLGVSPCTVTNMFDVIDVDSGDVICGLVVAAARCTRKFLSFLNVLIQKFVPHVRLSLRIDVACTWFCLRSWMYRQKQKDRPRSRSNEQNHIDAHATWSDLVSLAFNRSHPK
jgi:hypothetical protein